MMVSYLELIFAVRGFKTVKLSSNKKISGKKIGEHTRIHCSISRQLEVQ